MATPFKKGLQFDIFSYGIGKTEHIRLGVGYLRHVCHTWQAKQFPTARKSSNLNTNFVMIHKKYIDLDMYKNTDVVGILNDLEP